LVTYRISGGYFASPRWSTSLRKGRILCELSGVYSPEQVKAMSDAELVEAISRDIFEDAAARQKEQRIAYKGENLAEKLECALYICPQCQGVGALTSEGDMFSCACGLSVTFNVYGEIEGAPFDTIAEWDAWQTQQLRERVFAKGELIYTDEDAALKEIHADHTETAVGSGTLSLFADRLTLGAFSVTLSDLAGLSLFGRQTIMFSAKGSHYEIKWQGPVCARKYLTMFEILRARQDQIS
ncbi:MAG: hypothetical protein FWE69_01760, partial [Clostridiales bacterium]|nr:hypothetical protein [Clostridiales bacterium]